MHRGGPGNYSNSLDDLDRELALLRQKRELLESQQNRMQGGGRNGRGKGGGGGGGPSHTISPWDNNGPIQPLFNNSSDFNPQSSGGSGFNYTNLYDSSPRDQFRPPRRADTRKRVEPTSWNDRPNNQVNRQPPRKRSRPNPPAEQPRFQSGPRIPNQNNRPEFNRNSFKERSNFKNNRGPAASAPYKPPNKNFQANKVPNAPVQPREQFHDTEILQANSAPNGKMRGRLEHALGIILQNMRNSHPEKEHLFRDFLPCKTIKQMLRDRIKGLFLGKQVGAPTEIVLAYRSSFPRDDDIIKSVDSLISTTAKKVASDLDKQVKAEGASKSSGTQAAVAAVAKDSETVTVAKPNSGPTAVKPATAVKPSQNQQRPARSTPKRIPEADSIIGYFKENMHWAIDSELRLMFNNLSELYQDQRAGDENIKEAIKKILVLRRGQFKEDLDKISTFVNKGKTPKETAIQENASEDGTAEKKDAESDKNEEAGDKEPKTAENGHDQAENSADQAENSADQAKNGQGQAETGQEQAKNGQDPAEIVVAENSAETDQAKTDQAKTQEAVDQENELETTAKSIEKLCNYVLNLWLFKHLPIVLPKFRETLGKIVRKSLYERIQEETGNKEARLPARISTASQKQDQRYYVSLVGRPKLPKRPKLSSFLWRFNPCSVKRHKSIFNLLFVGFSKKEDYDSFLASNESMLGTCQIFIKPSKARPTNDDDNPDLMNASISSGNDVVIVEDRQGNNKTTKGMTDDTEIETKNDGAANAVIDFTEDIEPKKSAYSIQTKEDEVKNTDKTADVKSDAEGKEGFLDSMLDGAIVLDSVGDDDDDLLLVENPGKDSEISVHIDLDETVILADTDADDDSAKADFDNDVTQEISANDSEMPAEDSEMPAEKPVSENKEADKDEVIVINDNKSDDVKKDAAEEKSTGGVTTRRSSRLNN